MQCRTCGYALWNLTEPRCPECGSGFDLRHYRFKPGAVAFGCPFCGALHEGSGAAYLPSEQDTAVCQSCQQVMPVASMRVVLLSDDPDAASINLLPWQDRGRIGWFRAWLATCKMAMVAPMDLARRVQAGSSWAEAFWFAGITHAVGVLVHAVLALVIGGVIALVMLAAGDPDDAGMAAMVTGVFFGVIAVSGVLSMLLIPLALTGILGGAAHVFLRATGTTRHGFGATALAILYAQGPMVLQAIPICGLYINFAWQIWTLVVSIFTLKEVQQVSGARASFALLWLPILVMVLYVGVLFVLALTGNL